MVHCRKECPIVFKTPCCGHTGATGPTGPTGPAGVVPMRTLAADRRWYNLTIDQCFGQVQIPEALRDYLYPRVSDEVFVRSNGQYIRAVELAIKTDPEGTLPRTYTLNRVTGDLFQGIYTFDFEVEELLVQDPEQKINLIEWYPSVSVYCPATIQRGFDKYSVDLCVTSNVSIHVKRDVIINPFLPTKIPFIDANPVFSVTFQLSYKDNTIEGDTFTVKFLPSILIRTLIYAYGKKVDDIHLIPDTLFQLDV